MGRSRRRSRYRPRQTRNYTWQSVAGVITKDNLPVGDSPIILQEFRAGVNISATEFDTFDDVHTLERIRGHVIHEITGVTNDRYWPINTALFVIPAEIGGSLQDEDMPNLFFNGDGDDYPLFQSAFCDASTQTSVEIFHPVDQKARRRVETGSRLVLSATIRNPSNVTTADAILAFNLRLLWKLT